jgi:hypothetical protein
LELAGVEFIDENGGGPGVHLTAMLVGRSIETGPLKYVQLCTGLYAQACKCIAEPG